MQKVISHELPSGGLLDICYREENDFWQVESINLPGDEPTKVVGIWDDESVFKTEDYELRLPTVVLIEIISLTKDLVNDKDSWFSNKEDLREKLRRALK